MKIIVIGEGNIRTLMAVEFADLGHDVTVYTSKLKETSYEKSSIN